ncbi:MAG: Ig-like domain-containing protein [Candidatus Thiodiazotropha sp. (ex Epidulcina cf. delphinae)]|nr:Ig-like domain-containing protein [Candidatus Thiodiazotropha sp. (ex Epidulcina cf. delphinae)]MCU7928904.1 Ig-like domain-containing protein [Candidatus Thiodiazotropha sp. (ex Dulcina madagascariensis)]
MHKNRTLVGWLLLLSLVLSGCGGGSDTADSSTNSTDEDTTPEETPPAEEGANRQPSARISASQGAVSGETVTLDGSASSDPDGDALSYLWTQTQGDAISLGGSANPTLSFIAPTVAQPTTFTFQLSVNDGDLTDSASIAIQVSPITDTTPPAIVSRTPQPNETGVATTASISVTFDEPLLETLINNQSLTVSENGADLSGAFTYDSANYRLTFAPATALSENTGYTVTLASVQDLAGNVVQGENWVFTTGSQYNLGQTDQGTIDLCMSSGDKQMLTLVNNARGVARSCGTTNYAAAQMLAWHCNLEQAAQGHSTSMADNDFFDHTGLDGSSPGDRITAAGYAWRTYGENIAAGYPTVEDAVNVWLDSPGHCANLMNPSFTEMGAASADNPAALYRIYWTQNFADR